MNFTQFPHLEIAVIFERNTSLIKRNKLFFILIYAFFIIYFSIPSFHLPTMQYNTFRFTSLMEQRTFENNMLFFPLQAWTSIDNVSPNVLKAIISMEDGSFFTHKGIDWKELNTSLRINKRRGRTVRGGSTITMQTAKNLFLTTDKSLLRKAKEFIISFRIEKELTKKALLENYINAIEWGDGIFGINKASNIYFEKEPHELNANEASRLAAVIPSPLKYQPNKNSRYVMRRSSIIRGRLHNIVLYPEIKNEKNRTFKSDRRR